MKFLIGTILWLAAVAVFGDAPSLDPIQFLPAAERETSAPEWRETYARELARLADGSVLSSVGLRRTALFCRAARFPSDPALAARLVHGALLEADGRARRGEPSAAIQVAVAAAWEEGLQQAAPAAGKQKEHPLKRDTGIIGGAEQTLPLDKEKVLKTIDDKIKDKKDKKVK